MQDDLIRELEKEFTTWFNSREKGSKEKTLLEELEDLGGVSRGEETTAW